MCTCILFIIHVIITHQYFLSSVWLDNRFHGGAVAFYRLVQNDSNRHRREKIAISPFVMIPRTKFA